jgi:hypothetical protein
LRTYDFLNLSPPEFENLTRDLLQNELKMRLESFTSGKDKGIDLRHSYSKTKQLVVQCKRYKDFDSLVATLKKERNKIVKLKPKRYILSTSVGLNPTQKEIIQKTLSPYIETPGDIFGRDDLNNLLGIHQDVEKNHFKLWLASTTVLGQILHSKIHNQSKFEEEKVKESIRLYVENQSYYEAIDILRRKKYVIISGIPGIGKTTLARILVYHFLANGFSEFIFLSDTIKEGYDVYKEDIKQVFLFDDFLGRNFLEHKLLNNEEQRIVKFIEKISKSKSKILILTTREYILSQAKQRYDIFDDESLEFAKCVIDLSQYTKLVRAKILYNHLFFSRIPTEYIEALLEADNYKLIINHRNYNPRIIETVTKDEVWSTIQSNEFVSKIQSFLDYPSNIWRHVYENQISKFSQYVLANLMSAGTPILLEDLKSLMQNFAKGKASKYGINYSELEFNKSIRELENTFIITNRDKNNTIAVNYQNPSVQDFLVKYFSDFPDILSDIITTSIYFNQLFKIFAVTKGQVLKNRTGNDNKITINDILKNALIEKLMSDYEFLNSSVITQLHYRGQTYFTWHKDQYTDYKKLAEIKKQFDLASFPQVRNFVQSIFSNMVVPTSVNYSNQEDYLSVLNEFKHDLVYDKGEILREFFGNVNSLYQLNSFEGFQKIFPKEYKKFIADEDQFITKVNNMVDEEASESDESSLEDTLEDIKSINKKFGIVTEDAEEKLQERIDEKNKKEEEAYNWDDERISNDDSAVEDHDTEIENMFDSLRDDDRSSA